MRSLQLLQALRGHTHPPPPFGFALRSLQSRALHFHPLAPAARPSARPTSPSPILRQCRHFSFRDFFPFASSSSSSPNASLTISPADLTAISRKEADANANPFDVDKEIALLDAYAKLRHAEGWNLIIARWERFESMSSDSDSLSPILRSDIAFAIYLHALSQAGKPLAIPQAVTRRDTLLAKYGAAAAASTPAPAPTESASSSPALASSTEASPSSTGESLSSVSASVQQQASSATTASASSSSSSSLSSSERVANEILQGKTPEAIAMEARASNGSMASSMPAFAGVAGGASGNPVHVIINEPPGAWKSKLIRYTVTAILTILIFLTVWSYMLENSPFFKQEKGPNEYDASKSQKPVKFSDVHGVDEAKEELQDVIEFLKNPGAFSALGGKLPRGVLLTGPPGTGKTMLARAVAGEAGVPFLFASASEFEEMFVGVGAKRVRELFDAARKKQPAIVFIDEIDTIGSRRSMYDRQHLRQTLNQILTELDGFDQSDGIIVMAATNFPESLDPALVRPGRFDRHISVPLPDVRGRAQILLQYMKDIVCSPELDPAHLARGTPGFSGADLQNMVNLAAIQATKEHSPDVTQRHFFWARDRIIMGAERRSMVIDDAVKRLTAYHEGGHALTAMYTDGAMPLHKVTCMPRGHSLGHTSTLPTGDRHSVSLREFRAELDVFMGGRVAEELVYGADAVTSGASSDIQGATRIATNMVKEYGYSDKVGRVYYDDRQPISASKRLEIESEIRRLILEAEDRARKLLTTHEAELHLLANALVEHETLSLDEVERVLRGETLPRIADVLEKDLAGKPPPSPPTAPPIPARAPQPVVKPPAKKEPVLASVAPAPTKDDA